MYIHAIKITLDEVTQIVIMVNLLVFLNLVSMESYHLILLVYFWNCQMCQMLFGNPT